MISRIRKSSTFLKQLFFPTATGALAVFLLLVAANLILYGRFEFGTSRADLFFYKVWIPAAFLIAWFFQWLLVIPAWNRFSRGKKFLGLSLNPLFALICLTGGSMLGLITWEPAFGTVDLLAGIAWSIFFFATYGLVNLLVVHWLSKPSK